MLHRTHDTMPPAGLRRLLARAPIRMYHWHLGWMLGHRVLLLTHIGRTSGQPREVVVEIDGREEETGAYLIASGFGRHSDWYRNIQHTPAVTVQIGNRSFPATARALSPEQSGLAMSDYARLHPRTARSLLRVCGLDGDGTPSDYDRAGREYILFVAITPTT
jgi:deazaflavin-dependent oxidoreductase (nitroreductase family)